MSEISKATSNRPTFKVAHLYRCHHLVDREPFLEFATTFNDIVNNIIEKLGSDDDGKELWKYVRSLFNFDDYADCVPINAANLSIVFNPVVQFMNSMAVSWNRDISIQKRSKPFVYTIQAARELIASQLNVAPEDVAILRNGSDPNSNISNGLHFNDKEEVVVWDENHPTDSEVAWGIRKDRFSNINIKIVTLPYIETMTKAQILKAFLDKVNENTKLVTFSEVSHLSGTFLPAQELCHSIHAKNPKVHVHVDGAQNWGACEHDLKAMGCDSYSAGAHKWFLGPKETGFLYMKPERAVNFFPKDIGYDGKMQPPPTPPEPLAPNASRFEMIGQRNDTNIIGLLYTADLLGLIGFANIQKRVRQLNERLRAGLEKIQEKYQVFSIETPGGVPELNRFQGILVLKFISQPEGEALLSVSLYDKLYEDYKIALSTKKGNRMRFSPHIYNTDDHIDRCIEAIGIELPKLLRIN